MIPPVSVYRSIFRGRLRYATSGWLLEETAQRVVTATVPGAECRVLTGPRRDVIGNIAQSRERTEVMRWHTSRVLWQTPFGAAHALGHFWNDASGDFLGYYINLQAPISHSPYGFDSQDHVLDIVVKPDGTRRWKDEDEFEEAVAVGMFTSDEAAAIRAEGERVIGRLPDLLPTGWEDWLPDPAWPVDRLTLPEAMRANAAASDLISG